MYIWVIFFPLNLFMSVHYRLTNNYHKSLTHWPLSGEFSNKIKVPGLVWGAPPCLRFRSRQQLKVRMGIWQRIFSPCSGSREKKCKQVCSFSPGRSMSSSLNVDQQIHRSYYWLMTLCPGYRSHHFLPNLIWKFLKLRRCHFKKATISSLWLLKLKLKFQCSFKRCSLLFNPILTWHLQINAICGIVNNRKIRKTN